MGTHLPGTDLLTTDQKGAIAEVAITLRALELGIRVLRPVGDGAPYDLIFDVGGSLLRVQCKWAARQGRVVLIRCHRCRRTREGLRHRGYEADEVDGIAAYCAQLGRCFFVPTETVSGRRTILLRLTPTRNSQSRLVNWADDFGLESLQSLATQGP